MGALIAAIGRALALIRPARQAALFAFVSRASGQAINSAKSLMTYARQNPVTAALAAEALIRYGADATDLVANLQGPDADKLGASMMKLWEQVREREDSQNSGSLETDNDDIAKDQIRLTLGKVLVRSFGSLAQARQVQIAFGTLKEADFRWLEAMSGSR